MTEPYKTHGAMGNNNDYRAISKQVRLNSALKKIETFSKTIELGKWSKISRLEYKMRLIEIVINPSKIDQAKSNLCGIALPVKLLAEYNPEKFVEICTSLYNNGEYFGISANPELFNKYPTNNLTSVEYVILASIKNELNYVKYNPEIDNGFSGMTTPWEFNKVMEKMFGFIRTTEAEGTIYDKIEKALNNKNIVTLLINSKGFFKGMKAKVKEGSIINIPTHYIQVLKMEKRGNDKVFLEIWHWGIYKEVDKKQCKIEIPISQLNKMTHVIESWK